MGVMVRLVCLLMLMTLCVSCEKVGICEQRINNPNFHVTLLFECEGVKVYRFYDNGKAHYFTSRGEAMSSWYERVGKTQVYREENI